MDVLHATYRKPFVVVAIVLMVAFAVLLWIESSSSVTVQISTPVVPQSFSYHSTTTGIAFLYPSDYHLEERDMSTPERRRYVTTLMVDTEENTQVREGTSIPREGPIAITVTSYQNDLDKTPLLDWMKGVGDSNWKLGTGAYATTTVGRLPAVVYDWDGLYRGHTRAVSYGGYIHAFTVTSMEPTDDILSVFDDLLETVIFGIPEPV